MFTRGRGIADVGNEKDEGAWAPGYRALTTGLIIMIVAVALEALAVAATLPVTVAELGGLAWYGWAFSAFMLVNLVGVALAGYQADRSGPAKPYLVGIISFVAGLLVAGLAPSMPMVIAGRAIQGLGAGLLGAIAYYAAARAYPESVRPRLIALFSSAWIIPGLLGPGLAGLVAEYLGWRWVFLGLVPIPLLAGGLALPSLRAIAPADEPPAATGVRRASARLAIGTALLLAGLGAGQWWLIIGGSALGVALMIPALQRLLPDGTLRLRAGLPAAIATSALLNIAFFGADAFVPLSLTSLRGQSAAFAGLTLTAATLTWSAGAWIQERLAMSAGRRAMSISGIGLLALGVALFVAVLHPAVPVWLGVVAWAIAGLGMGISYSTGALIVLERAPKGNEGSVTSALQLASGLGTALGAGVGGIIVAGASTGDQSSTEGVVAQMALMILVLGGAALAARRLPNRPPSVEEQELPQSAPRRAELPAA